MIQIVNEIGNDTLMVRLDVVVEGLDSIVNNYWLPFVV